MFLFVILEIFDIYASRLILLFRLPGVVPKPAGKMAEAGESGAPRAPSQPILNLHFR